MKRALSLLLVLSLCLGMLPGNVWAEEVEEPAETLEVIEETVQEETTQPEEPETMETAPETEATEEVTVPEGTEAEETEPEAVEETEEYQEDTGDVVASGTCGDNLTWVLDGDGVLTVSGSGRMAGYYKDPKYVPWYSLRDQVMSVILEYGATNIGDATFSGCGNLTSVTIPNSVTNIGNAAFSDCSNLTDVVIPDSVTSIGYYAFSDCSNLTSVTIPNSVTSVSHYAFAGCSSLTGVTIPDSVTSIGEAVFSGCSGLTSLTISTSLTSISYSAFSGCNSLTSVVIPDSVTSIGIAAFEDCSSLISVTIPDSVTSIGDDAFYCCNSLISVTIPDGVTSIGGFTFSDCSSLTSVIIPDSVTSIGKAAFQSCSNLNSVTIPDNVTSISDYAFSGCSGLTDVAIPDNVTSIGESAFSGCSGLTSVAIPDGVTSIGNHAFHSCSGLTSVVIPDSVTSIGGYTFSDCGHLTSIMIPDSVTSIGELAFGECSNLTSVTIPDNVISIGRGAFMKCSSLTSITIPDNVTSIEKWTFESCGALVGITIPESVTSIAYGAFADCGKLKYVFYGGSAEQWGKVQIEDKNDDLTNATIRYNSAAHIHDFVDGICTRCGLTGGACGNKLTWTVDADGTLIISGMGDMWDYLGEKTPWKDLNPSKLVIEEGVMHIGSDAFANCESIIGDLILPDSIESIGWYAFYGCKGLNGKLTLSNHLKEIDDYVFWNCNFTGKLTLPDTLESIGEAAFCGCKGFTGDLMLPSRLTTIGKAAFYGCDGFNGNLVLPNSLKSIEEDVFYECSGFSGNLILPNSLQTIGKAAFCGCSGFTGDLVLPKGLQYVEESAFQCCDGFTGKIMLPRSITYIANLGFCQSGGFSAIELYPSLEEIGMSAFFDCTGLTDIFFHGNQEQWDRISILEDNEPLHNATLHLMVHDKSKCGDNLEWDFDEITGALLISGTGAMYDYDEEKNVAPWKDLPVKSLTMRGEITYIGRYAFAGLTELAGRLSIPYTVDEIGDYAFYNCSGLTGNLYLRGDLHYIGESAFENCSGFDGELVLPNELEVIGLRAFYGCAGFTGNLTFPTQMWEIGSEAFAGCKGFTGDLTIPAYVGGVADGAFRFCSGFSGRLKLPSELTGIGEQAFLGCSGFTGSLELPEDLNGIGYGAFAYCRGFTGDLKIPDNVNNIEEYTFASCTGLSGKIVLPRNLDIIGMYAFRGCKNITSIEMYDSVDTIESDAFEGCDSLTDVYYAGTLAQWNKINGHEVLDGKRLHLIYSISYKNVPEEVENPNPTMGESGKALTLQPLTRSGYKFIGWFDAPEAGKTVTTIPAGNTDAIILYARWVERGCTITFDGNGGTEGETEAIWAPWDASVSLPESTFIRPGYTFTAWNTQPDGKGKTYAPGDMVANLAEEGTVTLYAQWTPNTYTARFLPGAVDCKGTTKDMTKLTNGKSYTVPRCGYTRTGYVFAGWEMEGEFYAAGEKFAVSGVENEGIVEFTAHWTPITYTVHFNPNKGTGKMPDQKNIPYDEPTALNPCAFTRTGYRFVGWNTKANGSGETIEEALKLTAANNGTVTLYAQWEGAPYQVTFHFGDETRTQTLYYGTAGTLDPNTFEKPGYTFKSWNTKENGKGKSYKDGAKVTNLSTGKDVDLYAQWTANKYTVIFHSNLAKDTTKKQTLTYDAKETALLTNSFRWKGHTFLSWTTEDGQSFANKEKVRNLTTEKSIDLYADWKANEYTVVFLPNGAEGEEITQDMIYDVPDNLLENCFERPGYTFQGWATTAKGKAVHTDGKTVKNLTDKDGVTLRLYAVWAPTTYTVTFVPGEGATGTMKPMKMTYGKTYTLTKVGFKRANYTFTGWLNEETWETYANKAKVKDLSADGSTVTLTAQWVPTEYAITYKNLSTWEKEGLLTSYNVLTEGLPGTPSRPGCEFAGWFLDSACKKPFTGFENIAKPGKLTLYPKWIGTPGKYTIHFAPGADGVTGKMADKKNLVCGKDYTLAACAFKRSGYKFVGWEIGSVTLANKAKFSDLPAYLDSFVSGGTVTLTAKWVKIS